MKLVQIQPDAVPLGSPLPYSLRTEEGTLLAQKGLVIWNRPELDLLRERRSLYIEVPGLDRSAAARLYGMMNQDTTIGALADSQLHEDDDRKRPDEERLEPPGWADMQVRANWILRDISAPETIGRIQGLHNDLARHCEHNADFSLMSLIYLTSTDVGLYSATHAMLVTVICVLAARDVLRWEPERVQTLSKAALTMNFAMTELQDQLAKQVRDVDVKQRQRIQQHAEASVEVLKQLGVTDRLWLEAVHHHHDVAPGPLAGRDPSLQMARLIQRADMFAARLAPRATRAGMAPPSAMQAAYFDESRKVDEAGAALIKAVGVYPPGTFVKLTSNEIAIVVRRGANTTTPRVAVLINRNGVPTAEPIGRNTGLREFRIQSSIPTREVKVHVDLVRIAAIT